MMRKSCNEPVMIWEWNTKSLILYAWRNVCVCIYTMIYITIRTDSMSIANNQFDTKLPPAEYNKGLKLERKWPSFFKVWCKQLYDIDR